jgi:CRP/FNR family cyclic AMP-dependent transcriptional regulator
MEWTESLRATAIFSKLPEKSIQTISSCLKERSYKNGELLFNLGDEGNELIIVQEGLISIFSPVSGKPESGQPIRIFKKGETLGEMAIIDQKPRSTSARAESDAIVLTLAAEDFHKLLAENFELSLAVMGSLNERIRYTTNFLNEVGKAVQKVSEGDYRIDEQLAARITDQDRSLADLASYFVEMAANVKRREEQLRTEVAKLQIEIDEFKRKKDVSEIVQSDYFQELKAKIKNIREENNSDQ